MTRRSTGTTMTTFKLNVICYDFYIFIRLKRKFRLSNTKTVVCTKSMETYLSTNVHLYKLFQADTPISIFVVLSDRFLYPFFIYKLTYKYSIIRYHNQRKNNEENTFLLLTIGKLSRYGVVI